jgi:hypothetical protein
MNSRNLSFAWLPWGLATEGIIGFGRQTSIGDSIEAIERYPQEQD